MVTTHPQSGRPTPEAAPDITHTVPERSSAAPVADPDAASVPQLLSELHWRERHLSVRDAVLAIVNRATSLDAALQASLDEICTGLEWEAGAVYLVNRKAGTFDLTAQRGLDGRAVTAMRALPLGQWPLAAVFAGDDVQRFDRLDVRPEAPSWARAAGIVEWIGAPLASPSGTLGVICVASRRKRSERGSSWNDEALLKAVGRNLGVTVDHLRTHLQIQAALSERNARWTALYNTGVAVTRELDSEALLDEIVRRSVDLLAASGGVLSLLDEASGEIVVAVAYRRDAQPWPIRGRRLKAGEGINGAVLASRQPFIIENYAEWPGHMADLADQAVSIMAVPLLVGDHVRGVLAVSDTAARGRFTEEDVQTLTLFAQQAAAVWEHQRNRRQAEALTLHAERARLARDLHDGLAQDLASLLLRADLCQTLADSGDAALHAHLEAISTGLQRCIRDARATIFALRLPDSDTCSLEGIWRCWHPSSRARRISPSGMRFQARPANRCPRATRSRFSAWRRRR